MPFKHTLGERKSPVRVQKERLVVSCVPAWLYHNEYDAKIVTTQEEYDEAIEAGWVDSPDKVATVEVNS